MGKAEVALATGIGAVGGGIITILAKGVLERRVVPAGVRSAFELFSFKNTITGLWFEVAKVRSIVKARTHEGYVLDRVTFSFEDRFKASEQYLPDNDFSDVFIKISVNPETRAYKVDVAQLGEDIIEVYHKGSLVGIIPRDGTLRVGGTLP